MTCQWKFVRNVKGSAFCFTFSFGKELGNGLYSSLASRSSQNPAFFGCALVWKTQMCVGRDRLYSSQATSTPCSQVYQCTEGESAPVLCLPGIPATPDPLLSINCNRGNLLNLTSSSAQTSASAQLGHTRLRFPSRPQQSSVCPIRKK